VRRPPRQLATLAAALAALGLPAVAPAGASAHATLLETRPAAGAVTIAAPASVVLRFDQQVRPVPSQTSVTDEGGEGALAAQPHVSAADARVIVLPLRKGLADSDYTVRWSVVSSDGHLIQGVFAFGVGAGRPPPEAAATSGSTLDPAYLAARLAFFAGLLLLVGGAVFRATVVRATSAVLPADERAAFAAREGARSLTLLAGAAVLMLLGGWVALTEQAAQVAGSSFWSAFDHNGPVASAIRATRFGRVFGRALDIAAVVVVVALALRPLVRRSPPLARVAWPAGAVLAALAVAMPGLSGHAGDPGRGLGAVAVDALHVAAAAVWIGGLAGLFAVVPHATAGLPEASRRTARLTAARSFSGIALASVAVVSASGVGRALWEVGALSQLWTTAYGRTLLVKTGLLGVAVILGYRNRAALADFRGLRRRVGAELVVMLGIVAAVAVLTDLPPANSAVPAEAAAPPAGGPARVPLGGGARLTLWPGQAGANVAVVEAPVRASRLLVVDGGRTVALRRLARGSFGGLLHLPAGRRDLQIAAGARTYAAQVAIGRKRRTLPPATPARSGAVAAGRAGRIAVAGQRLGARRLRLTLISLTGTAVVDALVTVDGRAALPCPAARSACYVADAPAGPEALRVHVERAGTPPATARLDLPAASAPPAATLVRASARRFRSLLSLRAENDLSSGGPTVHTTYIEHAPDRVAWTVRGGAQAIIIGRTRWDRQRADAPWKRSRAVHVRVPDPFWARGAVAAHLVGRHGGVRIVTLALRSGPTFFRLWIGPGARVQRLEMVAAGHFMHERELDQNRAAPVVPPQTR
jgi:copper transport protein